MRTSEHRTAPARRSGAARSAATGCNDSRAALVALTLILLVGVAAIPLLSDGRVLDNLGAALRDWAGVNR